LAALFTDLLAAFFLTVFAVDLFFGFFAGTGRG
jgi:hypothetical protein